MTKKKRTSIGQSSHGNSETGSESRKSRNIQMIFTDSSPRYEFKSVAHLIRFYPEQEYQGPYNFCNNLNLRCNIKKVDFDNYVEYKENLYRMLITELSFNQAFMVNWLKFGKKRTAKYLAMKENEGRSLYLNGRVLDFVNEEMILKWSKALDWLEGILPSDIKVIRFPNLNSLRFNGICYTYKSFWKDANFTSSDYPYPPVGMYPMRTILGPLYDKPSFPLKRRWKNDIVIFIKDLLSDEEKEMLTRFVNQNGVRTSLGNDETDLELYSQRNITAEVWSPYFINRNLPLPIILCDRQNMIFTLICKKDDKVEIM